MISAPGPTAAEIGCTCTLETGCGEADAAGCPACLSLDPYDPCPVFGFICWSDCGEDGYEHCTPEQREMTRKLLGQTGT